MTLNLILFLSLLSSPSATSIHDFKIKSLDSDKTIDLADFKGKKILIVNVASKCGFTPQYEALQKLSEQYDDKLVVLGFPCDQFMGQELDTEAEIKAFCTDRFQVTFPMTTMVEVKGKDQHPIYQWLTQKSQNGVGDYKISWNFNKFMIDENGQLLAYFPSNVKPMDEEILSFLK
ncbi:MAG: glutathione peroxidase [Cyclobacteriaceae bacterium]|nr:glutathione peroxidase [Cyclobacteriaceae bacterium]